jgi:hypothetical protein
VGSSSAFSVDAGAATDKPDAPTVAPLGKVGEAYDKGMQAWGDTTAKLGLSPDLKTLPSDVVSVTTEDYRRYQADVDGLTRSLDAHTDMNVRPAHWSEEGNLARYLDRDVHAFVGPDGLRTLDVNGNPSITAKEIEVGKSVMYHGPGVGPDGSVQLNNGIHLQGDPRPPRLPDTLRQSVEQGAARLNIAGAALASYGAITDMPGQVNAAVQQFQQGDLAGALNSGSQAAQHAANVAATMGQVVIDGGNVTKALSPAAARVAGRFVPGANVAIAALDTAQAARTLADPSASTGKKVGDSITAGGSVLAATNIPVLSQIGAGVSILSSLATGYFASK